MSTESLLIKEKKEEHLQPTITVVFTAVDNELSQFETAMSKVQNALKYERGRKRRRKTQPDSRTPKTEMHFNRQGGIYSN